MTDETTTEQQQPRPKVRRGQLVSYVHHDAVTGLDLDGLGVVLGVEDGGNVAVRALSTTDLSLDPANVSPVAAGEVTA